MQTSVDPYCPPVNGSTPLTPSELFPAFVRQMRAVLGGGSHRRKETTSASPETSFLSHVVHFPDPKHTHTHTVTVQLYMEHRSLFITSLINTELEVHYFTLLKQNWVSNVREEGIKVSATRTRSLVSTFVASNSSTGSAHRLGDPSGHVQVRPCTGLGSTKIPKHDPFVRFHSVC